MSEARPGRPTSARVRADRDAIVELIAGGEDEFGIRAELGLSRRAYRHRMRQLKRAAVDTRFVWTRLLASANADLARLDELAQSALRADPPSGREYVRAALARSRLRRDIIEMGLALGIYSDGTPERCGQTDDGARRFRDLFPLTDSQSAVERRRP